MFRGRVRHVHFIGVGGIGMSGLAEILRTLEFDVSGSDLREGENTRNLQRLSSRSGLLGHHLDDDIGQLVNGSIALSGADGFDQDHVEAE